MRISALARSGGVSVPTVKFYLREGLLPEGTLTAPTQAHYGDEHLARLRLVRALLGPGGLSVATAREVIRAIDQPPRSMHELLGVAHTALAPAAEPDQDLREAHALVQRWGWFIDTRHPEPLAALAAALDGLRAADFDLPAEALDDYAAVARQTAAFEIAGVPRDSPAAAVRYVVLGTILLEPVILALRRLAQQAASSERQAAQGW